MRLAQHAPGFDRPCRHGTRRLFGGDIGLGWPRFDNWCSGAVESGDRPINGVELIGQFSTFLFEQASYLIHVYHCRRVSDPWFFWGRGILAIIGAGLRSRHMTRATLPLRGEVHALEEGPEVGGGAEGVVERPHLKPRHRAIAFFGGLLQPRDGLVVVTEPYTDPGQGGPTHIRFASAALKILEDREGLLFLSRKSVRPTKKPKMHWTLGARIVARLNASTAS